MPRTITVTDAATPALGATITGRTYRLLAADGTTVLSTANPPYAGVSDGLLFVEQTATQSDGQTNTTTIPVPSRVTTLAASSARHPVLTWTDSVGETSYELHRGAPGFTVDVAGGTTRVISLAAGAVTYTDGGVAGDGSTSYAYRLVGKTALGYVISNEAACIPAAPTVEYSTSFPTSGALTAYSPAWVQGPAYNTNDLTASGGSLYITGNGTDGAMYDPVVPASSDQSVTATVNLKTVLNQTLGLVFRATGSGNSGALKSYQVLIVFQTDHYELWLVATDGTGTTNRLGPAVSLASLSLDTPYEFYGSVFDANGGVSINGHIGGVALSYSDTSAGKITAVGRRGLYAQGNSATSPTTGLTLLDYEGTA